MWYFIITILEPVHFIITIGSGTSALLVLSYLNQDYILVPAKRCGIFADAESWPLFLLRNVLSSRATLIVEDQHNTDEEEGSCSLQIDQIMAR